MYLKQAQANLEEAMAFLDGENSQEKMQAMQGAHGFRVHGATVGGTENIGLAGAPIDPGQLQRNNSALEIPQAADFAHFGHLQRLQPPMVSQDQQQLLSLPSSLVTSLPMSMNSLASFLPPSVPGLALSLPQLPALGAPQSCALFSQTPAHHPLLAQQHLAYDPLGRTLGAVSYPTAAAMASQLAAAGHTGRLQMPQGPGVYVGWSVPATTVLL